MRILVMDDYKSHGESLAEFLGTKGHEAIYAETCADAEWLLDLMKFDFALLDFDMPGMSGPSVAAKLSKRFPHLRAAIMSAKAPTGTRRNELGSLDFLQKPVRPEALIEVLRRVQEQMAGVALVQRSTFSVVKYK